jgi:tRNA-Thr(GGU) m(6)t(6)A37 methyltransferase TsaA
MTEEFQVFPIGHIRSENGFFLQIERPFVPALKELNAFSHIQVLYWFHLCDTPENRNITEVKEPYRNAPARMGIFATRSPVRPNPIALSVVQVLGIDQEQGLIEILYIDAAEGSPIIDLKPYHPSIDRIREAAVPKWCSHWPKWYEDSAGFDWDAEFVNAR